MGKLSEKESKVTYGNITGNILAEYDNGSCSKVIASIEVEGYAVTWSLSHSHGEITLWDEFAGGFTSDWKIGVSAFNPKFMLRLRKEIESLVKSN